MSMRVADISCTVRPQPPKEFNKKINLVLVFNTLLKTFIEEN